MAKKTFLDNFKSVSSDCEQWQGSTPVSEEDEPMEETPSKKSPKKKAVKKKSDLPKDDVSDDKVEFDDLLSALTHTVSHKDLNVKLQNIGKRGKTKTLDTPLTQQQRLQIERKAGFEKTSKDLKVWDPIVKENRLKDQLEFPLNQPHVKLESADKFQHFQPASQFEKEVASLLKTAGYKTGGEKLLTKKEEQALKAKTLLEEKMEKVQKRREKRMAEEKKKKEHKSSKRKYGKEKQKEVKRSRKDSDVKPEKEEKSPHEYTTLNDENSLSEYSSSKISEQKSSLSESRSMFNNDEKLQSSRNMRQEKEEDGDLNPQVFFQSEMGTKLLGTDHHSDEEENNTQKLTIAEAFATDDIVGDFEKLQREHMEKKNRECLAVQALPGWGSWGGEGIKTSKAKKKRYKIEAAKKMQKHLQKNLIISEKVDDSLQKHQVSKLPFPFKNIADYESSIRQPIGKTWNTHKSFKDLTAPRVQTYAGKIIQPITKT